MANTFIKIETITLTSDNSSITFTNIPQTYTDLFCITSLRNAQNNYGGYQIQPNSVTSGYTKRGIRGAYSTSVQPISGSSSVDGSYLPISGSLGSTFGNDSFYIANYRGSQSKSYFTHSGQLASSSSADATILHNWLISTDTTGSVTSLRLWLDTDTFVTGSSATLYGIKNS